jgi:ATP-dependent DNA ligase
MHLLKREDKEKKEELRVAVLDMLYLNGETYSEVPLRSRLAKLDETFAFSPQSDETAVLFRPSNTIINGNMTKEEKMLLIEQAMQKASDDRTHAVIRHLDSSAQVYHVLKTETNTAKFIVLAVNEKSFMISLYMGAYNAETGDYRRVGVLTLSTNDQNEITHSLLAKYTSGEPPQNYRLFPSESKSFGFWLKPKLLIEVKYSEVRSNTSNSASGVSVREMKILRIIEDYKEETDQVTTLSELQQNVSG